MYLKIAVSIDTTSTTLSTSTNQYPCVFNISTTAQPYTISSEDLRTYTQTEVSTDSLWHSGDTDDTTVQTHTPGYTELPSATTLTQTLNYSAKPPPPPCSCVCPTDSHNITDAELEQKLTEIKKKLTVNKTSLSSTVRKKTSAPDGRISSVSMGAVGVGVIVLISMAIVAADLCYFISFLRSLK
jgi:hypothetical protein